MANKINAGLIGCRSLKAKDIRAMKLVASNVEANNLIVNMQGNKVGFNSMFYDLTYKEEILEEVLISFAGTIIFISHDRYFINKVANRVAELEDGEIADFIGNYDEYREQKARRNPFSGPGGATGPGSNGGPQKVLRRETPRR